MQSISWWWGVTILHFNVNLMHKISYPCETKPPLCTSVQSLVTKQVYKMIPTYFFSGSPTTQECNGKLKLYWTHSLFQLVAFFFYKIVCSLGFLLQGNCLAQHFQRTFPLTGIEEGASRPARRSTSNIVITMHWMLICCMQCTETSSMTQLQTGQREGADGWEGWLTITFYYAFYITSM